MLAILNNNQILSHDGKPVHGRFYVFQKDTNQVADVFTYDSNNSLVSGQNPIYTDIHGFPEYEVILEDKIYSVVVERYLGNYADPKTDDRPEMWEICNSYYFGVQVDQSEASTIYSMNSLPETDTALGSVNVIGYYNSFDCGQRTYVWDENSIDLADGGYVVRSNKSSTGRWILLNDLPYIPSEYYGVYPGHLENMNKLTDCPDSVGYQGRVKVPSCIKFATGTYNLTGLISTGLRAILVDNKTCFGNRFNVCCQGITVLGTVNPNNGEYIGKLNLFNAQEIRYSWFADIDSFLTCPAEKMIVDSYGINNELARDITLRSVNIEFAGGRLFWTSSNNYKLTIDHCLIDGEAQFITDGVTTAWWNCFSENTRFSNMVYSDKYVRGGGNAASFANCTLDIDNFKNSDNFFEACLDYNYSLINLQGHVVNNATLANSQTSITITNGTINNLHVNASRCEITLINCVVNNLDEYFDLELLSLTNCIVNGEARATLLTVVDSHLQSNVVSYETIYATNSQFDGNITGYTIGLYGCIVNGVVWPKDINGTISAILDRNRFTENSYIKLESDDNYTEQVKLSFSVTNNTFLSTQYNGLKVQVFSTDERYLHDNPTQHAWIWEGNIGTCLQTFSEAIMDIDMLNNNGNVENIRFISFGIIGTTYTMTEPISIMLKEVPAQQSVGSQILDPIEYLVTENNKTSYFYITKYKFNDYFAHRFHLGQGNLQGKYWVSTKTIGRN